MNDTRPFEDRKFYRTDVVCGTVNALKPYDDYWECLFSCAKGWMPLTGYRLNNSLEAGEGIYHPIGLHGPGGLYETQEVD